MLGERSAAIKKLAVAMLVVMLISAGLFICSCASEEVSNELEWEDDPIVPGYSVAEINIGDTFSAVQNVHGEPEREREDGGYLYAYYGRTREGGTLDEPGAWRVVVTLYDNANGYLDTDDEVGSVEVSAPYSGKTAGGNGIASTPEQIEEEFGPCPNISESAGPEGERLELYSYTDRGVEFLVSGRKGTITVMVTDYGGLLPVEGESEEEEAQGGLFGQFENDPIIPGQSLAGIGIGEEFVEVKRKYGVPDSSGFTTEGLVYATYTGGYGSWKLNLYLEDTDDNESLGDYDTVISISVRHPYAGKTAGGVGISSSEADVISEFGTPQRESTTIHQGEETRILEYNTLGIVFAIEAGSGMVKEIDVNLPSST